MQNTTCHNIYLSIFVVFLLCLSARLRMNFDNRMISTSRNIRQRCQLKYSKHGTFTWDKWIDLDCIFSSDIDSDGRQHNQLEFHSRNNLQESNARIIDLTQLHSLTCLHGNPNKNEPKDIIILKIDSKRHRLGFDNIYEYNQWKTLLDGVFNSSWDVSNGNHSDENATVNMLYESVTAMRYRVHFADLQTQEILALPSGECDLIFDMDKLILEQRQDKQYTFPRSTIRTIRLVNNNEIEFELGSRAPVQGFIRFRFDSTIDARSCYSQWNEGVSPLETSSRESSGRYSVKQNPQSLDLPIIPPRIPLEQEPNCQPPRPPPRSLSIKSPNYNSENPYYNSETPLTTPSSPNGSQSPYMAFQTLV